MPWRTWESSKRKRPPPGPSWSVSSVVLPPVEFYATIKKDSVPSSHQGRRYRHSLPVFSFGDVLVFQAQGADPPREALCVLLIIFIVFIGCSVSSIRKGLEDTLSGDVRTLSGDVRTLSGDVRGFCIVLTRCANLPQDEKIPLPGEEGAMLSE